MSDNRNCFHCKHNVFREHDDGHDYCVKHDKPIPYDHASFKVCKDFCAWDCTVCGKPIDVDVVVSRKVREKQGGWRFWCPFNHGTLRCYDCYQREEAGKLAVPLSRFIEEASP